MAFGIFTHNDQQCCDTDILRLKTCLIVLHRLGISLNLGPLVVKYVFCVETVFLTGACLRPDQFHSLVTKAHHQNFQKKSAM